MKQNKKESYLRQIKRRLNLPREIRERVISDLDTTIEARLEQGETMEEILASMGSVAETAAELNGQMSEYAFRKSKWRFVFLALAILAVIWLVGWTILPAIFFAGLGSSADVGIIGGADGPTAIIVSTTVNGIGAEAAVTLLLLAVGVVGYLRLSKLKK